MKAQFAPICPIPLNDYPTIQMAHGGGGRMMHKLIEEFFVPAFENPLLSDRHDGAVFNVGTS
ncbi:MAG TPA: hypothetical protein VL501_02940, partial [Pyrinomonadaceae bacterium]|nr:hypothetical protein [Pyrinomonadaceae bacterium]